MGPIIVLKLSLGKQVALRGIEGLLSTQVHLGVTLKSCGKKKPTLPGLLLLKKKYKKCCLGPASEQTEKTHKTCTLVHVCKHYKNILRTLSHCMFTPTLCSHPLTSTHSSDTDLPPSFSPSPPHRRRSEPQFLSVSAPAPLFHVSFF